MATAVVIVDFQYDFYAGSLAVPDAENAIDSIIELGKTADFVAFTRDNHPADHISFSDDPQFVDKSWPPHCVQGTPGVEIHPVLKDAFPGAPMFDKGEDPNVEQYSGAEGVNLNGQTLVQWLKDNNVTYVQVVGLATDYCVSSTARDLSAHMDDFDVDTVVEAQRPVAWVTGALALRGLEDSGVFVLDQDLALATLDAKKA